ncbi:MAG TPA: serine/threonine-protein kinase, partial [Longimicrobiales bacterium]|nr:serine/threonine-protein kinase [Longimicrobiales bacterium]
MTAASLEARLGAALAPAYELVRPLGAGGMGSVYLARQAGLERMVAVKVLAETLAASAGARQRFLREARAVAGLAHPNVVAIHAVGEMEDGTPYFVMQYVEGTTLAQTLRSGPLPIADARRLLCDLASALEAAHERAIVHRDVKPENILLEDGGRRALLTDFGIAKALDDEDVSLTGTRTLLGSPHYMSPEQAAGDAVDAPTDIYSLGVVVYHALAGRTPFQGETLRSLIKQHITAAPPPLTDVRP